MAGQSTRFSLLCNPGKINCSKNINNKGKDTTMPATNESFIERTNPSVGFSADIILRLPCASPSVLGLVLSSAFT